MREQRIQNRNEKETGRKREGRKRSWGASHSPIPVLSSEMAPTFFEL